MVCFLCSFTPNQSEILGLTVLVQYRRVTDEQTDRGTDGQTDKHTTTAYTASHGIFDLNLITA